MIFKFTGREEKRLQSAKYLCCDRMVTRFYSTVYLLRLIFRI